MLLEASAACCCCLNHSCLCKMKCGQGRQRSTCMTKITKHFKCTFSYAAHCQGSYRIGSSRVALHRIASHRIGSICSIYLNVYMLCACRTLRSKTHGWAWPNRPFACIECLNTHIHMYTIYYTLYSKYIYSLFAFISNSTYFCIFIAIVGMCLLFKLTCPFLHSICVAVSTVFLCISIS